MAIYVISYDLRAPGRNYESLYKSIKTVPYAHPLESVWLVETDKSASAVHKILRGHMDKNDGLLVVEFTEDADWHLSGINKPSKDWIATKRK